MSTGIVDNHYLNVIYVGYHFRIAALSLLVYDYFLTLEDEVELFWKRPWSTATYLFFWTRYGGMLLLVCTLSLVAHVSNMIAACIGWFVVEVCLGVINTWVIEAALFLRLYALYNCSRKIALATAVVFLVQILSVTAVASFAFPLSMRSLEAYRLGGVIYCEVDNDPSRRVSWLYWGCFGIFETFVLFLTIRKGNSYYRCQRGSSPRLTRLVSTLYWDSIYYSVSVEMVYMINIILILINDKNYDVMSGPGFTLPVIMGGRMMINIRKTISDEYDFQTSPIVSQITLGMNDDTETTPSWALAYV